MYIELFNNRKRQPYIFMNDCRFHNGGEDYGFISEPQKRLG